MQQLCISDATVGEMSATVGECLQQWGDMSVTVGELNML